MAENIIEDLKETFEQAAEHVKTLVRSIEDAQLLKLYGRYKQATVGKCNTPKPHMFDFQGKAKWNAWSQLGNMSPEEAMTEYISLMDSLDESWRSKVIEENSEQNSGSFGISVSTMKKPEDEVIRDDEKTALDWCKEGNLKELKKHIKKDNTVIDYRDSEGLTLLHWACDRGFENVVKYLLGQKANINHQDTDDQTALHYACICEHQEIVKMLLDHGANPAVKDATGSLPADHTDNQYIKNLLNGMSKSCLT
ncbi:acyl-CoA-binding domain-containing protein 6-like [Antedon mediterranea]|uniref:acyl-CoA-binding domain-containing protein 6-like n=1 Tax=Antedon mediterranea TaxID=105859 RepID=UPI003AF8BC96